MHGQWVQGLGLGAWALEGLGLGAWALELGLLVLPPVARWRGRRVWVLEPSLQFLVHRVGREWCFWGFCLPLPAVCYFGLSLI